MIVVVFCGDSGCIWAVYVALLVDYVWLCDASVNCMVVSVDLCAAFVEPWDVNGVFAVAYVRLWVVYLGHGLPLGCSGGWPRWGSGRRSGQEGPVPEAQAGRPGGCGRRPHPILQGHTAGPWGAVMGG